MTRPALVTWPGSAVLVAAMCIAAMCIAASGCGRPGALAARRDGFRPIHARATGRPPSGVALQAALLGPADVGRPDEVVAGVGSFPTFGGCTPLGEQLDVPAGVTGPKRRAPAAAAGSGRQLALIRLSAGPGGPAMEEELLREPASGVAADAAVLERSLAACTALGYRHGPVHAELAVTPVTYAPGATSARLDGREAAIVVTGEVSLEQIAETVLLALVAVQEERGPPQEPRGSAGQAYRLYSLAVAKAERVLGR